MSRGVPVNGSAPRATIPGIVAGFMLLAGQLPPSSPADVWVNVTGNLAGMASECGNSTILSPVPGSGTIIAGVALKGLWANSSGSTWSHLGSGAGSDTITNRPTWIAHDPTSPGTFWESGIYNGGGVYRTTDHGRTFHRLGSITHNDYVSVDFSDPDRHTLSVKIRPAMRADPVQGRVPRRRSRVRDGPGLLLPRVLRRDLHRQ